VAFDTRIGGAPMFTGRASRRISRLLRARGYRLLSSSPGSFLVSKQGRLLDGEAERAMAWGAMLGEQARSEVMPA
jgi:hypothetical protein